MHKHVVGVANMHVSSDEGEEIITYALGSCLGIALYDPVARVGGLVHVMLPTSEVDPKKADTNPCMFVDTGVPALFKACYKAGAEKQRMQVKVAGGASVNRKEEEDMFQIGKRNMVLLRKLLWKNGVMLSSSDVGGTESRTMAIQIGSGLVTVKSNGVIKEL